MKLATLLLGTSLALTLWSVPSARAEDKTDCAIKYTRTACPGQEAESYKKCDGKKSCLKYEPASSAEQCKQAAAAACSNDRLTITASKVVNATFQGKPLKTTSGKEDFCAEYEKREAEYNHCAKK
jgi:hypothetical protein